MLLEAAPFGVGLIFFAFVALVIVGIIYGVRAERQRREALEKFAADLGLSLDTSNNDSIPRELQHFTTFNQGDDRTAYNTLTGSVTIGGRSFPIRIGDYRYDTTSGTGKDRTTTTHRLSYLHVRLPFVFPASMTVRRENVMDRIAGAIGFEDIDFESSDFSRKFYVRCSERKLAYDLLDPRMIEWYLGTEPPTLEIENVDVLLTDGRVWTADQMRWRLQWATEFIERWPTHLVQQLDSSAAIG
jgi:hypothetical protein